MPVFTLSSPEVPGATESPNYPGVFILGQYAGTVIATWEVNGYDDSDFVARCWDTTKGAPVDITYGTTRGWTYAAYAKVDATPEVIAAYEAWSQEKTIRMREAEELRRAMAITPDKTVAITVKRGKNAALNGKTGTIFWVGTDRFSSGKLRVGVKVGDQSVFLSSDNVSVLLPATA